MPTTTTNNDAVPAGPEVTEAARRHELTTLAIKRTELQIARVNLAMRAVLLVAAIVAVATAFVRL